MSTKADHRLHLLLTLLRDFYDYTTPRLSADNAASSRRIERMFADAVMFNLGWHAAKITAGDELRGSASTEQLLPRLIETVEHAAALANADRRLSEIQDKLAPKKAGRPKGSVEEWHHSPGYTMVAALAETQPETPVAEHIRRAIKDGMLDGKNTDDKTHARRVTLVRQRWAKEEAARLAALGDNIVKFPAPKKRRRQ